MKLNDYPLWTAIITPMNSDGSLDLESYSRLLEQQEKAGNGVVLLGSTGEALALNETERKQVIEYATGLNLSVPLLVGIGGFQLEEQIEWMKWLNGQNVHGYLVVTPLYAKPGRKGQTKWFETLLDISTRPCMLYNVPSRTGIAMNFDSISDIKEHKNFWAIKEASGSVADFKRYSQAAPKAMMYSGDDGLTLDFCQAGGAGLVSVMSNVWPKETRKFVDLCLEQKTEAVKGVPEAAGTLFLASNPIPTKILLKYLNHIPSASLRAPLTEDELEAIGPLVEADEWMKKWYQEQV